MYDFIGSRDCYSGGEWPGNNFDSASREAEIAESLGTRLIGKEKEGFTLKRAVS